MKKYSISIACILLFIFFLKAFAEEPYKPVFIPEATVEVSTAEELKNAVENATRPTTIIIKSDFSVSASIAISNKKINIIADGNRTVRLESVGTLCSVSDSGELYLGFGMSEDSSLTFQGEGTERYTTTPMFDVGSYGGYTEAPRLYMDDNVKICDNNTGTGAGNTGAGVQVSGGIFYMYGGEISNNHNPYAYGGGVGVLNTGDGSKHGKMVMYGGKITGNSSGDEGPNYLRGGGVYVDAYCTLEIHGGEISNNFAYRGGGIYASNGTVTMTDGIIEKNSASSGGGIYAYWGSKISLTGGEIRNNTADYYGGGIYDIMGSQVNVDGCLVHDNHANRYGGGVFLSQYNYYGTIYPTVFQYLKGGLYNNTAGNAGADLYSDNPYSTSENSINRFVLNSGQQMNQKFKWNGQLTRFLIDGWYYDGNDPRWSYDEAFKGSESTNRRLGDTYIYTAGETKIIAAFTPYDSIEITKVWNDDGDREQKRPDSVTYTLTDPEGRPVKLRSLDGVESETAQITLTADNQKEGDSNAWIGSIEPLDVRDYSGYKVSESAIDGYTVSRNPVLITADTFTPDAVGAGTESSGIFKAEFTNTIVLEKKLCYHPNADDASGTMECQTGKIGTSVNVFQNKFTRPGYAFVKWNTRQDGQGTDYEPDDIYTFPDEDAVLYAQWKSLPHHIIYNANGGNGNMEDQEGIPGEHTKTKTNEFSYQNHVFTEWNTKADGSGITYKEGADIKFETSDITLYAQWEEKKPDPLPVPHHITFFELSGELPQTGITGNPLMSGMKADFKPLSMELNIPRIDLHSELVTVEQQNGGYPVEELGMNGGLLADTDLPGKGHAVIAGHNTVSESTVGPFARIWELEPGDRVFINSGEKMTMFEVCGNEKISSTDFAKVKEAAEKYDNTLTLLTCEDERLEGGYASRRIVTARLLGE